MTRRKATNKLVRESICLGCQKYGTPLKQPPPLAPTRPYTQMHLGIWPCAFGCMPIWVCAFGYLCIWVYGLVGARGGLLEWSTVFLT